MAAGYYPLDPRYDGGKALKKIADDLRELLDNRGAAAWDNDQHDNASSDGGYETYLYLALELIERCLEKPKSETP